MVNTALLPLLALGLLAAVRVGYGSGTVGPVLLWCVCCLAVGGTAGFLFGIPKAGPKPADAPKTAGSAAPAAGAPAASAGARPNTNLEEISDWLTKIIIGLTLVHLQTIEEKVRLISRHAAAAIQKAPTPNDVSAATALVVGLSIIGFLCGYLYTRLFLQGAIVRSDKDSFEGVLREQQRRMDPVADTKPGEPSVPTAADREAAARVQRAAPAGQPDAVLAPLRALAAEYEQVRRELEFGRARTQKMGEIATRMKALTLAARPYLATLAGSTSPGERLAAVMVLQMDFDPEYITWLADRLHVDAAFIGYQAASALLARIPVSGAPEMQLIRDAVEAAKARIAWPEAERDALVQGILDRIKTTPPAPAAPAAPVSAAPRTPG